jgi:signal transduction histidine kinase
VADNGPGIPEELMDKIFIPFFTAKESGTGIGLSLSRQIMLMHGGTLKMESCDEIFLLTVYHDTLRNIFTNQSYH